MKQSVPEDSVQKQSAAKECEGGRVDKPGVTLLLNDAGATIKRLFVKVLNIVAGAAIEPLDMTGDGKISEEDFLVSLEE